MNTDLKTGMYEAQGFVNIRLQPRITKDNIRGGLDDGKQKMIYSIKTDGRFYTWGRLTQADNAGDALWVCIQIPNRVFMKYVGDDSPPAENTTLESRVTALESRMAALEGFSHAYGFEKLA